MKEYIFNVILFYIPIAGIMIYFFRNDGIQVKQIWILLGLSLLIILSFPVCMERLGTSVTFILYFSLSVVVVWNFFKGRVAKSAANVLPCPVNGEQLSFIDGDSTIEPCLEDVPGYEGTKTTIDGKLRLESLNRPAEQPVDEFGVNGLERADLLEITNIPNQEIEEYFESTLAVDVELAEQSEGPIREDSATVLINNSPAHIESDGPYTCYVEDIEHHSEQGANGNGDESVVTAVEEQIKELIDMAFACRESNPEESAGYYQEAWRLTSDYDLKYLLTMELVEIYKENGCYNEIVRLLNTFITLPGSKPDILNQINRQLKYINLLVAELKRLGIGELPVSKIPRLVRLKVDEQINFPGV
ncbi:MAG: hypothetical protein ACOX6E_04965 [Syntrophomonadaceae bacterium]|jgi:hypothetical protein